MKLQVLNPVAESPSTGENIPLAPRLTSLEGKRIGLFWNLRSGGDAALKRVEELLKTKFSKFETKLYTSSVKSASNADYGKSGNKNELRKIAEECAAVIGSTAD